MHFLSSGWGNWGLGQSSDLPGSLHRKSKPGETGLTLASVPCVSVPHFAQERWAGPQEEGPLWGLLLCTGVQG